MDDAGRTADAGDAPTGPRGDRPGGRPARPVAAMLTAALLVLASTATWYIERRTDSLEQQRRQDERALFERACNDPISAAAMVINMPTFASRCPVGLRHLLSIPVDEVRPGPALVDAYLNRLFVLLGAQVPGGDVGPYLTALHRDDDHAAALRAANRAVRSCRAVLPTGPPTPAPDASGPPAGFWDDPQHIEVRPQRSTVRVNGAPGGATVIDVRVVETTPSCLTRPPEEVPVPRYIGTTALNLSFSPGTGPNGQQVWLLDRINACPVHPDPLASASIVDTDSMIRHRSIRASATDSLFAYAGSTCPSPPSPR
ncbi:hypothetical protein [Micromonospora sagamiensis]|uniref:Uncharacterized protein n=1 Tax=Micromonospora sagamiensis TaxID=47875 RepID=A0A562WE75_9ACTN|nr:hypothetical protein [Micromonospora sagamiensis]TWJ28572.1 hypothetical protein JD81_02077 [Micromonospora sagamiensis]BCL12526.1 hypothetical protein GCM10017556_02650 [Micromonospora sagamiensis]